MFQELMLLGLSLPISVFGYLAWTRGVRRVLPLAVPIAMLAFLVPVTQATLPSFSHSLQLLSAEGATAMLQLAGLPATRAGVVITTGITTNTVTQDCSGLATLQALLLYGLVMGFVFRLNARRLAAMVGVLLVLSLAVNAARVAFISWLLYTHGVEVAEGPLHNGSGYVLFAVAYSVSFALTLRLAKTQPTQSKMNAMIDQSPVSA